MFPFVEWSRETLLEKWMKDPVQCCQLAGVQPPTSALQHCGSEPSAVTLEYNNAEPTSTIQQQGTTKSYGESIVSVLLLLIFLVFQPGRDQEDQKILVDVSNVLFTVWDLHAGDAVLGPISSYVVQSPILHILLGELPHSQDSRWRCSPHPVSCLSVSYSCACGSHWKISQPWYGTQIPPIWHQGKVIYISMWRAAVYVSFQLLA